MSANKRSVCDKYLDSVICTSSGTDLNYAPNLFAFVDPVRFLDHKLHLAVEQLGIQLGDWILNNTEPGFLAFTKGGDVKPGSVTDLGKRVDSVASYVEDSG